MHQSSLRHKDLTLRHFVVSSTSVRRTHVIKLEMCVHIVVLLCSMCRNLYRTRTALISCFNLKKKLLLNHTYYFEELVVNMLHHKTHVNDGFGVTKVVTSIQNKKEDKEHGKPSKKF